MKPPIHVIALGEAFEAEGLRTILERMGLRVMLHLPGSPATANQALKHAAQMGGWLVLSGHGGVDGFWLGEFGKEVDTSKMVGPWLPANALIKGTDIGGLNILSTACSSASFQSDFVAAASYLAPTGEPDGPAMLLWAHHFFFAHFWQGQTIAEAFEQANTGLRGQIEITGA